MSGSKYAICPKCGVTHSTLVRHRCFKPEGQKEKPKFDPPPDNEGGDDGKGKGDGTDGADGKDKSPEQGEGQGKGQGEGEGEGEGQSEGEGGGEQQEGEGDPPPDGGESEAEGQGEGPPPEEELPPVAVVVTVLKYAALTAKSTRKGIAVVLTEQGLKVSGYNKQTRSFVEDTIPWGEFEKRSTLDGEMYVREIIDGVADQID